MARGRRGQPVPDEKPHPAVRAPGPPTPDEHLHEHAVYQVWGTTEYFYAEKTPAHGTWFLLTEPGRPGRNYKVLGDGTLEVTWASAGWTGTPIFSIDDVQQVSEEMDWCGACLNPALPNHDSYCDPPGSVDEYEWLLTEKYT